MPRVLEEAKAYVRQVAARLSEEGARARALAQEGPVAGTILGVAEREKVTLIAMATHGRTGLSRWVFGSVAEKVLRTSPVPLLVLFAQDSVVRRTALASAVGLSVTAGIFFRPGRLLRPSAHKPKSDKLPPPGNFAGA